MKVFRITAFLSFIGTTALAGTGPNLLLITIDTLRADRVGCYGYRDAFTPTLDSLAARGWLFTNAVSPVPLTRPAHISLFTGLYPYEHGIRDNIAPPLDPQIPVLAEILKKNGYTTAAFVSAFVINSQSGLQRGFDLYQDRFDPKQQPSDFALNLEKRGGQTFNEFAEWFSSLHSRPYFAWIHLYDPHFPYEAPPPFGRRFASRPYDGEVAYADSIVGKILNLVKPDRNTLVIITSDHGEGLGDHGENAHSFFIYDATLKVPLIFYWPDVLAPVKINQQVRLIDLFPTILDYLNVPLHAPISGVSLRNLPAKELIAYSETLTPFLHFGWSPLYGVRTNSWKFIYAPQEELYDLKADAGESKNLIAQNRKKAAELKEWLQRTGALKTKSASLEIIDPETLEAMASLGYAGVSSANPTFADPKSKLSDFKLFNRLIREGIEAFQKEKYEVALVRFQELRKRNIPSFEVHYYLGRTLWKLKKLDQALIELGLAIEKLPHFLPAYVDLSNVFEEKGDWKEAEKILEKGLQQEAFYPTLVHELAWLYQKQKKYSQAEKLLLGELDRHPGDLQARYRLAAVYRDSERIELAVQQLQEIIKRRPEEAEAHNQLGMMAGGSGNYPEAARHFRDALRYQPESEIYRKNLNLAKSKIKIRFRMIQAPSRGAAEAILRKLKAGEPWEEVARQYSTFRNLDVLELTAAEMAPFLVAALDPLTPGQISEVIATNHTFCILRKE